MARSSPLRRLHQEAEASLAPYGPPEADILLVETFGDLDLEYAAIRKACVLIDCPHRGTVEITGKDRHDFLNRMITQQMRGFEPFHVRRGFWLTRAGRIDADMRLIELGERLLVDVDAHAAGRTVSGLSVFVISEDIAIREATEEYHRLALHGPTSAELMRAASQHVAGVPVGDLAPDRACRVTVAGREVIVDRDDAAGEPGLNLLMKAEDALAVYQQLVETGQPHNGNGAAPTPGAADAAARIRLRPAGWHAFNVARIEAGRPIYNLDFGPDSLPHETGVLRDRVSFTKGCYLGQEIVARMEARGRPKQRLVGLKLGGERVTGEDGAPRQPVTGALVHLPGDEPGDAVGVVTSSAVSPMLGATPVCFAMVRTAHTEPGTRLAVEAEGAYVDAVVQPSLTFWTR